MIKNCLICNKEFYIRPSRHKKGYGRFCCRKCYEKWYSSNKGNFKHSNKRKSKIKCSFCGKELFLKNSLIHKNNFCNKKCLAKYRSKEMTGRKLPKWWSEKASIGLKKHYDKVGRSERTLRRRVYDERYKDWRMKVFTRDNFTCQVCQKVGGELQPHHIKSWAKFLELRYVVDNGITLCLDCHKLTDNYGNKQ